MKIWRMLLFGSLLFSVSRIAGACTCVPATVKERARDADIIFRGTLVEHKGRFAVFKVDEQWKGDVGVNVDVEWREGDHGDCDGFWSKFLKVGNNLLVFASRRRDGTYHTDICLLQKFAAEAQKELGELGPGKPPHDK